MAGRDQEVDRNEPAGRSFSPGHTSRLTLHDLGRFPGDTLFDRLARAVCRAECLPRKELYEAWEMGRRVRRHFRGGRVVDVAGGHGLLAFVLVLLDGTSPEALVVDPAIPASAAKLADAIGADWPEKRHRVSFLAKSIEHVHIDTDDLVVSAHACGALTDVVIDRTIAAGARVAVLPCCHDLDSEDGADLRGWLDGALAQDVRRAERLRANGYRVRTQLIPADVTPKNRLLLGSR